MQKSLGFVHKSLFTLQFRVYEILTYMVVSYAIVIVKVVITIVKVIVC